MSHKIVEELESMHGITMTERERMLVVMAYNSATIEGLGDIEEPTTYVEEYEPPAPPPTFNVFIIDEGEERLNLTVSAESEKDAVLNWYRSNNLTGELKRDLDHNIWTYHDWVVYVERDVAPWESANG